MNLQFDRHSGNFSHSDFPLIAKSLFLLYITLPTQRSSTFVSVSSYTSALPILSLHSAGSKPPRFSCSHALTDYQLHLVYSSMKTVVLSDSDNPLPYHHFTAYALLLPPTSSTSRCYTGLQVFELSTSKYFLRYLGLYTTPTSYLPARKPQNLTNLYSRIHRLRYFSTPQPITVHVQAPSRHNLSTTHQPRHSVVHSVLAK